MKLQELMTTNVITVDKNITVQLAAGTMNKKRIGCLMTVDKEGVKGILTERDMLIRVLEAGKDPKTTMVSDVMTQSIIFGNPTMQLAEATRLMFQNGIKKLPILKDNQLVGLVTLTDIARATSSDKKTINLIEALSNMHRISPCQEEISL
jgi:signal-transduction protein with cAMP-binding, CBS, and nucleotidyltransferase domain